MLLLWNGNPWVEFGVEASCPETWLLRPQSAVRAQRVTAANLGDKVVSFVSIIRGRTERPERAGVAITAQGT